jgi:hypothetical protein
MQYLLLIYGEEAVWEADPDIGQKLADYGKLNGDLRAQGKLLAGEELQPIATATTVQVRDGETVVSDGPFAETKEVLGGFYAIEAETLDEAIEWAAKIPDARLGKIEIRPVVDHSGAGA